MKRFLRCFALGTLPILWLTLLPPGGPSAYGGWGAGGCAPAGPVGPIAPANFPAPVAAATPAGWQAGTTTEGKPCFYLWDQGGVVAGFCPESGVYRSFHEGRWSEPQSPPWAEKPAAKKADDCACCPECGCEDHCTCGVGKPCCKGCRCIAKDGSRPLFGVEADKIGIAGEQYRINGRPVTKEQAERAVEGGQLPDDAGKLRLTLIGPEPDRRRVLGDLSTSPALAFWRDQLVVQDYAPDHWAVKDVGFVTGGRPTIYLQKPDGTVLLRQDAYEGAEALAQSLRKADPNYKPDQDPNGKTRPVKTPALPFDLGQLPPAAWLAGGLVLIFLFRGRQVK
jgi:hypothetical protein